MKLEIQRKYPCKILRVIDADTLKLEVDVGFRMSFTDSFRLIRINAPELRTDEGKEAKKWLIDYLRIADMKKQKFYTITNKHGKYRWLADIFVASGRFDHLNLNDEIVKAGHAIFKEY